jgi:tol-pal system protein YbgF
MKALACTALMVVVMIGLVSCVMTNQPALDPLSEIRDVRALQAEQSAKIIELRDEIRRVAGKVDELEYIVRGKTEKLQQALEQVTSRVPPPEGVSEELLADDEERISQNTGSAAEQYRQGLGQLRSGDFKGAYLTFSSFIDLNPNTAFTDNALYWTAVCFEKMGQYDRAIVAFSDVYQRFPAEDRVPHALYRLAGVLVKMGSAEDAKLGLRKLIDDFPKHPVAAQAKQKLNELSKNSNKR